MLLLTIVKVKSNTVSSQEPHVASLVSQAGFCSKGCLLLFTGNLEVQAAT